MTSSNRSARRLSLKTKLAEDWASRSSIIRHSEQPTIAFNPARLAQMFQQSGCLKEGFCHCRANPEAEAAAAAVKFCQKWAAWLKPKCWSKTNKATKKKEKSSLRTLLEQAALVVSFHADGAAPSTAVFFHLGYGNYSNWKFSCLELFVQSEPDTWPAQAVLLRAGTGGSDVRMMVDAARTRIDLGVRQSCALYVLDGFDAASRNALLRPDEMAPCSVGVSQQREIPVAQVWKGAECEMRANPRERPAAQRQPRQQRVQPTSTEASPENPLGLEVLDVAIDNVQAKGRGKGRERLQDRLEARPNAGSENDSSGSSEEADAPPALDLEDEQFQDEAIADEEAPSRPNQNDELEVLDELEQQLFGDDFPDPAEVAAAEINRALEAAVAAAAAAEVPAAAGADDDDDENVLALERRAGIPELRLPLPGNLGELRFNPADNFFRAHCPNPDHGKNCSRRRAAFQGRQGQGRPLGLLLDWLKEGRYHASRQEHMAMRVGPYERRLAARNEFQGVSGIDRFTANERARFDGEEAEPRSIP